MALAVGSNETCEICETVMTYLKNALADNATKVTSKSWLSLSVFQFFHSKGCKITGIYILPSLFFDCLLLLFFQVF